MKSFFSILEKLSQKQRKKQLLVINFIIKYTRKPRIYISDIPYKICHNLHVDDVIIFPETMLDYSTNFYNLGFKHRVFWWLSWNNAPTGIVRQYQK